MCVCGECVGVSVVCACVGVCVWREGNEYSKYCLSYRDFKHHSQIDESLKKVEDLKAKGEGGLKSSQDRSSNIVISLCCM